MIMPNSMCRDTEKVSLIKLHYKTLSVRQKWMPQTVSSVKRDCDIRELLIAFIIFLWALNICVKLCKTLF